MAKKTVTVDFNTGKFVRDLTTASDSAIDLMEKGMVRGMRDFESKVVKEQLSGRPGLKRRTGALANSTVVKHQGRRDSFSVTFGILKRAWYAVVHQTGKRIRPKRRKYLHFKTKRGWVKTKEVNIPKRLYIPEDFRINGLSLIRNAVRTLWKTFKT